MRRDSFRLDISNVAWLKEGDRPQQPTLTVHVTDGTGTLRERLSTETGGSIDADAVDITFRLQDTDDGGPTQGVLAIANRLTGEFILELNVPAAELREFVAAARRYAERTDEATRYRVRLTDGDAPLTDLEKRTLLVYSSDGELLRQHSLIPSGVEI